MILFHCAWVMFSVLSKPVSLVSRSCIFCLADNHHAVVQQQVLEQMKTDWQVLRHLHCLFLYPLLVCDVVYDLIGKLHSQQTAAYDPGDLG